MVMCIFSVFGKLISKLLYPLFKLFSLIMSNFCFGKLTKILGNVSALQSFSSDAV